MESMKDLGERIRDERIAQGLSMIAAAKGAGLARDTWRKIEEGGSVHDTKRHAAMKFLGITESNTEWGRVGQLEDHAAVLGAGEVNLNVMFSQAVRFAATVGILVPPVREEAERVSVALSDLFAHGLELWDQKPLDERTDLFGEEEAVELILEGGDGHADADAGGSASTSRDDYELIAHIEEHTIESEQGHDETP